MDAQDTPSPGAVPLRLASWNIRAGLGTDLRRDPMRVARAIAALGADIVALQEADFRRGARPTALPRPLLERVTGLVPVPVERGDSLGWHGNAVLHRPDMTLRDVRLVALPGLNPRGALVADLDAPQPLRVVALHLALTRRMRRRQIDVLRTTLATLSDRPTVILGDFNEWSADRGLGRLARDYRIVTPGPTYPAGRPVGRLDRFAHSPDLALRPLAVPPARGAQPSDHRPVLAECWPT